jgi:hypothetical protein
MQVQVSLKMELAATASLTQMEQQIQEAGQQAMREALKQAIRHWEDQNTTCPHCGQQQRRLEGTVRRMMATVFGRVQVQRRRFRCQLCQRRWCPANGLFAELKGGTISVPIRTNLRIGELFCLEGEHLSRHSQFLLAGEIRLPTIISMPGCLLSEPRLGRSVGWCSQCWQRPSLA